jgi:hypothetical protein
MLFSLLLLCFTSVRCQTTRCSHGGLDGTCTAATACPREDHTPGRCSASTVCCIRGAGAAFRLCQNGRVDAGETCQAPLLANVSASPTCCSEYCRVQKPGTLCRPSAGPCDPEELCEGAAACPVNQFFGAETMCRPAAPGQLCDVADVCNSRGAACPQTFKRAGDECRAARGACDAAEECSGKSGQCPDDQHAPVGTTCDDGKVCTDGDRCGPSGACIGKVICSCTADAMCNDGDPCTSDKCNTATRNCEYAAAPAGTVCRPSRGDCDPEEFCNGLVCPADVLLLSNQACRPKADLCDEAELCTGRNFGCPPDIIAANGTLCRNEAGACDVADRCNGLSKKCADVLMAKDTQCSAPSSTSPCAGIAVCSGESAKCPAPQLPDGSACDDGNNCTMSDQCIVGQCVGQRSCSCKDDAECDDKNACITERCGDGFRCVYTPLGLGAECVGDPTLFNNRCNAAGFCVGDENPPTRSLTPATGLPSQTTGALVGTTAATDAALAVLSTAVAAAAVLVHVVQR